MKNENKYYVDLLTGNLLGCEAVFAPSMETSPDFDKKVIAEFNDNLAFIYYLTLFRESGYNKKKLPEVLIQMQKQHKHQTIYEFGVIV